ncbi:MAG TPA: isoleucine--tRNA ligase, partial [Terriglobales bacterium]|nr:isoleucine--tRNA ligase [Terriglobales bacterium]
MGAPLDLKSTLNLPKTDFPMKANLPQNEPKMLARWEELRLYDRIRQARKGAPIWVLHDGPPYSNGPIHLGHALNKCLKDFIVKTRTMLGYDSPYVPGWDCHGLPIEIKVDESLGGKKLQMAPIQVRQACRKYAEKYLDLQREQFKRIGVFGRFDRPYSTMTPEYESVVLETLYAFFEKDAVYKGLRPVYWCIHDKTALAEAEVEYENHTSPSIWVKYPLNSDPAKIDPALAGKKVSTIIWTTTPWTLPASLAVTFHPDEEYVAIEAAGGLYIVAEKLAKVTEEKCGLKEAKIVARFPGRALEHTYFYHPFLPWPDRKVLGVLANYVTMDQGTGAVHTAPSHGSDDFYTGQRYKLDATTNVDEAGIMRNGLPEYDGKTVFQANPAIIQLLRDRGVLMHEERLEHSYPHCWRCHRPVIFRATEQWFISMEAKVTADGRTLRQTALDEIKKVKWDPEWGEERISNMIATRPDWCISRQRVWGVPIAVFFCGECGQVLKSKEANHAVLELVAREGVDAWYTKDAASILPPSTKCSCGGTNFRKEMDIIDVWFESGSSHFAVLGREEGLPWPSDLYIEGGDQYRGWFHSSLLCAVGAREHAPYRMVATNGWTLDPEGRAMSKSLGNVVDPVDIADRMGAEIVRLWVASVDFREDVTCSEELMRRISDNYRKIRNTLRFVLQNLYDFDPSRDAVAFGEMQSLDQFMLLQTADLDAEVREWYTCFQFHKAYQRILNFCVVDLSAVYFDVLKDRLYTWAPGSRGRRSAQTAIWRIGEALVRLLAPMMSFTADEVWRYLPRAAGRPESVHLAQFLGGAEITGSISPTDGLDLVRSDWETLLGVRSEVLKALEEARNAKLIGGGLEAKVSISAPLGLLPVMERRRADLRYLFIVSEVEFHESPGGDGAAALAVKVTKAPGQKCERCWNYSV